MNQRSKKNNYWLYNNYENIVIVRLSCKELDGKIFVAKSNLYDEHFS